MLSLLKNNLKTIPRRLLMISSFFMILGGLAIAKLLLFGLGISDVLELNLDLVLLPLGLGLFFGNYQSLLLSRFLCFLMYVFLIFTILIIMIVPFDAVFASFFGQDVFGLQKVIVAVSVITLSFIVTVIIHGCLRSKVVLEYCYRTEYPETLNRIRRSDIRTNSAESEKQ